MFNPCLVKSSDMPELRAVHALSLNTCSSSMEDTHILYLNALDVDLD